VWRRFKREEREKPVFSKVNQVDISVKEPTAS